LASGFEGHEVVVVALFHGVVTFARERRICWLFGAVTAPSEVEAIVTFAIGHSAQGRSGLDGHRPPRARCNVERRKKGKSAASMIMCQIVIE